MPFFSSTCWVGLLCALFKGLSVSLAPQRVFWQLDHPLLGNVKTKRNFRESCSPERLCSEDVAMIGSGL